MTHGTSIICTSFMWVAHPQMHLLHMTQCTSIICTSFMWVAHPANAYHSYAPPTYDTRHIIFMYLLHMNHGTSFICTSSMWHTAHPTNAQHSYAPPPYIDHMTHDTSFIYAPPPCDTQHIPQIHIILICTSFSCRPQCLIVLCRGYSHGYSYIQAYASRGVINTSQIFGHHNSVWIITSVLWSQVYYWLLYTCYLWHRVYREQEVTILMT